MGAGLASVPEKADICETQGCCLPSLDQNSDSTPHYLGNPGRVTEPFWALVSLLVKWGLDPRHVSQGLHCNNVLRYAA